jgi:hypothetical protein
MVYKTSGLANAQLFRRSVSATRIVAQKLHSSLSKTLPRRIHCFPDFFARDVNSFFAFVVSSLTSTKAYDML